MKPELFADIVFDRPLDHAFSYAVPESLRDRIAVGKRVECPFGRGDKKIPGFCVGVSEHQPDRAVKAIATVLDDEVLLDDQLLKLTRWMADYYLCGWGQVLHAIVPAGVRDKAGTKNVTFVQAVPKDDLPNPIPTVTPKQKLILERLREEAEPVELNQLAKLVGSGVGPISGLVTKRLVRKFSERVDRFADELDSIPASEGADAPLSLNADQAAAWETLLPALQNGGYHGFLLHGVTGSGKTEIYLRAIDEVIRQGKEAIVLVPEISLTPQTVLRFQGRSSQVAVMHSNLTDSERGGYWRRIAKGYAQVVVGARSAVFAPTRKLGLIVMDEEHETTFKQESTPRYHARDVAVMRARLANVPILLGSATPSLESWHQAIQGEYTVLNLPNRVENRPLPAVRLVDLRHEPKTQGKRGAIGPTLEGGIRDSLKAKGQVILLLNRRGYSTHVHCPACGVVASCDHCDLALTFHRAKAVLLCHHCGFTTLPVTKCTKCVDGVMSYQGLGTEKLQRELEERFPDKVVQRMDSDTMTKTGSHQRVLDAFRDGLVHILLGTQMIAKGLDFPNVTLVGVINADVGLHMPDFRAAERTFQLLAQVAGRAGRGDKGGLVMVQTYTPEHPCITLAAKHDFLSFAQMELAHRREHSYPPYQKMARLIVRSEDENSANDFANLLAGAFREAQTRLTRKAANPALVRVLGPAECPVFKLKDFFRFHFQLQSDSSGHLHEVLREVLTVVKPPSGVEFQVDVDPYSML
jgi:primosomal protein N' (replication factor Y) (superfamily II helicase)